MAHTGENEQALRKIIDFTRYVSLFILATHIYVFCHGSFREWGLTHHFVDQIILTLHQLEFFQHPLFSKLFCLLLLLISLLGVQGKKEPQVHFGVALTFALTGTIVFIESHLIFQWHEFLGLSPAQLSFTYLSLSVFGYLMILAGGTWISRVISEDLKKDIFNIQNESFPQEERFLENEFSINLPARYTHQGKVKQSWINIINPFRSSLVIGTPGAGKSYFVIRHIISQHIAKGFSMFIYDFKYDDLSRITYNALLRNAHHYKVTPEFYVINFDDLSRTHRCNPLDPTTMEDITDATESSRTIMLGLNRDWIKKQGDFFVESPINFVTAIIWFLRQYEGGRFCTLPHVIELMQLDYKTLFTLLRTEPEIEVLINPFESAFKHNAMEQLEGQIASAKIGMARLASPQLYYVLSGRDFTLDINNPKEPKVVCMGNNPQKQQIYGAVLSLYISRVIKLVNKKNQLKSSLVFDEFPTIYFNGIDGLIATARANKVATTLAVQDYSQLKKDYGREQAEVIMNIVGNVISGQVVGDTARLLSERFGKIVQERQSLSINASDTSLSRSTQLDSAIPASKIAALSSGEFVGMVSDDPVQKIKLKVFHAEIVNDHDAIRKEEERYEPIPAIRRITQYEIQEIYYAIKEDIKTIIKERLGESQH
ncbi:MAG: type IV secretory system conjugative DNA transfer family protein [Cyclobacteriaceae bacterium]|nr:type IV secretory system conjugative DNA transfer family protein [Cyclobacteriaceae bacterium]